MDLEKFKDLVETWTSGQNIKLSGVAITYDGERELWSASLIYDGPGSWPAPSEDKELITKVKLLCVEKPLSLEFELFDVNFISFIMTPDIKAKRWQCKWFFRSCDCKE